MDSYYNTIKWSMTVGVNSGFDLSSQKDMSYSEISTIYLKVAKKIYKDTNIYISGVIMPSRILYNDEWGCPLDGEISYTITGSCNTEFSTVDSFTKALKLFSEELRKELKQTTLLLEICPAHLDYLK